MFCVLSRIAVEHRDTRHNPHIEGRNSMVRRRTKLMLGIGALAGLLIGTTGTSFAQEIDPAIAEMGVVTDTMWLLLTAFLVFFMQAGFALVEAGSTQSKNMINIMFKNLMDFCIAALAFWMIGWGIAYGATVSGFFGTDQFFLGDVREAGSVPTLAVWLFQVVFAGTAATIVSGAMAERTKFAAYLIYSLPLSRSLSTRSWCTGCGAAPAGSMTTIRPPPATGDSPISPARQWFTASAVGQR
jgi:small-conductance mechanosensitive channel